MIEFIVEESGETLRIAVDALPVHFGRAEEAEVSVINSRASRRHARRDYWQFDGPRRIAPRSAGAWAA